MFLPFCSASQFLVSHLRPYPRQPTFYRLLNGDHRKLKYEFPVVFISMLEKKKFFLILHCKEILHCNRFLTVSSYLVCTALLFEDADIRS